jgi:phage terminase large subunit
MRRTAGRPAKEKPASSGGIAVTDVFMANKEATVPIVANRGGARSSKSYSIIQLLTERFFSFPGRKILMLRKTLPSLRKSTYRDFQSYLDHLGLADRCKESKMEMCFSFGKSLIQFGCLDDPSKIKSTEWNDIFMEEGTEFTYDDFMVLRTRLSAPEHRKPGYRGSKAWIPNQLFIAFNPEDENHWLKDKLIERFSGSDLKEIVSNYKDNPFLSDEYVKILLDLEEQDPNYFRIYGLGEWGKLDHVIYSNWDLVDSFPGNCEEIFYGLDFGFNNPSALIKVGIKDDEIYEEEKLYQTGLTNSDLIVAMNNIIPIEHKRNSFIFCDSAEPDRISEISDSGYNVVPADKSIKDGIDMVKRFKTHIVRGSDNFLKEKKSYSWKVDKRTERILDEPIKFNNHAVDAERYAIHTFFKEYGVGPMVRFI